MHWHSRKTKSRSLLDAALKVLASCSPQVADAVQTILLRWVEKGRYDVEEPEAYLAVAVRRELARQCDSREAELLEAHQESALHDPAQDGVEIKLILWRIEEQAKLGNRCMRILYLWLNGHTPNEIAEQLRIRANTVHQSFHRVIRPFLRQLAVNDDTEAAPQGAFLEQVG